MPKAEWRLPSTRRTLDPIAVEPLVRSALGAWRSNPVSPALIQTEVSLDGGEARAPVVRKAKPIDHSGVFRVRLVDGGVKIRILEEACRRELQVPRRPSQHLATLAFWKPVRVLLNGKYDSTAGRFYVLQDYHIVLSDDSDSAEGKLSSEIQFFDLQADLF